MGLAATIIDNPFPPVGTISRVMRSFRVAVNSTAPRFPGYRASLIAKACELDGKVAWTLFFPVGAEEDAKKARRLGWANVTEAWQAEHGGLHPWEEPRESKPTPKLPSTLELVDPFADARAIVAVHVAGLEWSELRDIAKDRGLRANGSRSEMEQAVVEDHFPAE